MEHSLLSPNQLWVNGLVVDTCPRQFSMGESIHGIFDPTEDIYFQFWMHGCISFLPMWLSTNGELEECCHVYMMLESEWEPYSNNFSGGGVSISGDACGLNKARGASQCSWKIAQCSNIGWQIIQSGTGWTCKTIWYHEGSGCNDFEGHDTVGY